MKKIIIDANVAHEFTLPSTEATEVISWIKKKGLLAIGGLNLIELQRKKIGSLIIALKSAGRAVQFDGKIISRYQKKYNTSIIKSDDPHIIALAVVAHARILYSRDQALQKDFTNPAIIKDPRGKCYNDAAKHRRLLI